MPVKTVCIEYYAFRIHYLFSTASMCYNKNRSMQLKNSITKVLYNYNFYTYIILLLQFSIPITFYYHIAVQFYNCCTQ